MRLELPLVPTNIRLALHSVGGLAVAVVLSTACRSSQSVATLAPAAPEGGAAGPVVSPEGAAPAANAGDPETWRNIGISMQAPPGSTQGMGCDAVMPPAWRSDGGLGGLELNESGSRGSLRCAFIDPKDRNRQHVFEFNCDAPEVTPAELRARRDRFTQSAMDARDIPNAGLIAWAGTADGMGQAHVYDDKSPCELVMNFVGMPPPNDDFVRATYGRLRAALRR